MLDAKYLLARGEIGVAHLSDLHFGSRGAGDNLTLIAQIVNEPQAIPSADHRDLVDSPDKQFLTDVRKLLTDLNTPFYVCAGNHDRFRMGNRANSSLLFGSLGFRIACALAWLLSAGINFWTCGPWAAVPFLRSWH